MENLDDSQSGQSKMTENEANKKETTEHSTVNTPVDVMPSLEELLKKAELDAVEHHDAWLRAKADSENIRKRAQVDIANAHKYAIENFSTELLTVMDSLEAEPKKLFTAAH